MNWNLASIILLVSISIFNVSLISFGYFILCMVLISQALDTYSDRKKLARILTYYVMTYMLIDVALILGF